jgi:DNA-binding NarL/FixJ family response regulator
VTQLSELGPKSATPDGRRIRVGIIDDHPMVVGGIAAALRSLDDLELVAQGGTLADARELLNRSDIDVCLLDVRLDDGNGLQVLSEKDGSAGPAVLVVSTFEHAQYIAAAVRFGAAGFLVKSVHLAVLVEAIRTTAAGGSVFTREQLRKVFISLTPKERVVLELAMEGLSNKEIGARVGTSAKTVEGHLSEIFGKYGIHGGRIELTMRAVTEGWLEIDPPPNPKSRSRDR